MRHRVKLHALSRPSDERKALMRSLVRELFIHGTIVTTTQKAKAASEFAERIITRAMAKDLSARRYVNAFLNDEKLTNKVVDEIAPKFTGRKGGYTRIIKMKKRNGDNAELAIFQLVKEE
ncbi:MAG: 50S ribosomal protein L17 [Mesoaciditoga sp.]|uniref:50S ribosomal protein L17 n=1 Tax=Athalassotoga TaxID=1769718 RepID=UPI000CB725B7|nr:50S ribosomal protein L17 [Athalassotoga saccharophila]PMP69884.1 MAG: 50S ribosomal protein L17 [Mesoaciditoga sp.]PMP79882.1 MAG: 50S ribosomal protein L17 [Mesoaciditoga sp.]BBJ27203.1 50S ribosomal protein L17 [Athalassotoga saccharophila]HEU23676.1 50S ribosomal protein L17 [Mesoaciditoga lauensis]